MIESPLPEDLQSLDATALAARICAIGSPESTRPFWADGGHETGRFSPGGHLLAAFPSRTGMVRTNEIPFRGLDEWLRNEASLAQKREGLLVLGLSYDAGRSIERLPSLAQTDPALPDVVFAEYPAYLQADTQNGPWKLFACAQSAADQLVESLQTVVCPELPTSFDSVFEERTTWTEYAAGIENVLQSIRAGDLYQANIARRIETSLSSQLAPALYLRMRQSNPAAYGTLWCIGLDSWIASSSPECLFTYSVDSRKARSFPIKGTRRRGNTMEEDARLVEELQSDSKELAEHVMIVDLVRNDLGRVCEAGTVEVSAFAEPYQLPTVNHLVSDIQGTLSNECDLTDLILALFPGGSITGAPKIAAMEKIESIERVRRGFYTGSIGIVDPDGSAHFNILIRTCVVHAGRLYYQTGGGIVADSTPKKEWDETCAKAHALTSLLSGETNDFPK